MIQIDACKNGDKEALGELYTTYADRLLGVCRHYVKDDDSARDVLHDAFIIIFTSIRDLKDESKLEGWMIAIVRNLSLKYLQSTEKGTIPLSCLDIELQEKEREGRKDIELGLLLAAIESLPEGNREVFRLSVLDGLSHKEIGGLLGINPHSSSSQLFRAKKALREMLINYWMFFLLLVLIPVCIYFITRDRTAGNRPVAADTHENQPERVRKESGTLKEEEPGHSASPGAEGREGRAAAGVTVPEGNIASQRPTDSAGTEQRILPFNVDSLPTHLAIAAGTDDSSYCIPLIPQDRMTALNERTGPNAGKKKHPWTFNFGCSSNAGAGGAVSNLDYLSLVDYANGSAAARLYTWADLEDYYARNNALMDSVERARMSLILRGHPADGNGSLGEVAHHFRPKTFGLSINRQLSPKWTFGTGITYTRLKSEFESEYHKARLVKTQKTDYVGIPLRLTYQIWSKGRFSAYTTGGMAFEMPVHSSLEKKYIMTADSSYTLKSGLKAHCQWSVNLGVGVQYRIFKPFSLYLEPNMFYYFRNGSGLETYRTEHPFIITVPFGLRLTW